MSDDRYCRFHVKLTVDGFTLLDGFTGQTALNAIINALMVEHDIPTLNFSILRRALPGYHLHYDVVANGRLIALEIACVDVSSDGPPQKLLPAN